MNINKGIKSNLKISILPFVLFLTSCSQDTREQYATKFMEEASKEESSTNDVIKAANVLTRTIEDRKVYDGPLGLKRGLTKEDIKSVAKQMNLRTRSNEFYEQINIKGLPSEIEHLDFLYIINVSHKTGLCSILGISGQPYHNKGTSDDLKDVFIAMESSLTKQYGKPTTEKGWAMEWWNKPEIWIYSGDRRNKLLYKEWSNLKDNPHNLQRVALAIDHKDIQRNNIKDKHAMIEIYYEFDNYGDCLGEG